MLGKQENNWIELDRRTFFLGAVKLCAFGALSARLYHLQILKGADYRMLSDKRRISIRFIDAPRALLKDRSGTLLALQKNAFQAFFILPKKTPYTRSLLKPLIDCLSLGEQDVISIEEELKAQKKVLIKEKLTWEEVSFLESRKDLFPYICLEVGPLRQYVYRHVCAHVLGYVGVSKEKPKAHLPKYQGKIGIERLYNDKLSGKNGFKALAVNARYQPIHTLDSAPAKQAQPLVLSLSQPLQSFIAQRLARYESAACMVMHVSTGEILAMVSHPSFDPNIFCGKIPLSYWKNLLEDPFKPLLNKAVSAVYPPASLVKMVVALAGLDAGIITENTSVCCRGVFHLGGHAFHCHSKKGHGTMRLVEALACSCDVFFYWLSLQIPHHILTKAFHAFGFGQKLIPDFIEEKAGLLPTAQWKEKSGKGRWTKADALLRCIGQGAFLSTPLQLTTMMARVLTNTAIVPTFLPSASRTPPASLGYDPQHLALLYEGMHDVVNAEYGTAFAYRLESSAQMGGKTGTSQVRRISTQQRAEKKTTSYHLPWEYREHTLFAGYFPENKPLYVATAIIEHGIKGAPEIVRDVFSFLHQKGLSSPN